MPSLDPLITAAGSSTVDRSVSPVPGAGTLRAIPTIVCLVVVAGAPAIGSPQSRDTAPAETRIRDAAAYLASGPYTIAFEGIEEDPAGPTIRTDGRAIVAPQSDGDSRFRVELTDVVGDADPVRRVVADDGRTVRVVDAADERFLSGPRHRAGAALLGEYLGKLLPMILRPSTLEGTLRYSVREGKPWTGPRGPCPTTTIPLPGGGGWHLSFTREEAIPCRFLLDVRGPEGPHRTALTVTEIRPLEEPSEDDLFRPEVPAGFAVVEPAPSGLRPGDPVPPIEVDLPSGDRWRLADHRGDVVLVDFWATWCAPCRDGMRELQALIDEHPEASLVVLGLHWRDDGGDHPAFLDDLGVRYSWADGNEVAASYGVPETGIPALFVIGPDGRLADSFLGALDETGERALRELVDSLLRAGR